MSFLLQLSKSRCLRRRLLQMALFCGGLFVLVDFVNEFGFTLSPFLSNSVDWTAIVLSGLSSAATGALCGCTLAYVLCRKRSVDPPDTQP